MSNPFTSGAGRAPAASRKPFMDFQPPIEVAPTVGLGKDVMVYICDDQEELRRLGPRRPVDEKKAPALGGPRGDNGNEGDDGRETERYPDGRTPARS